MPSFKYAGINTALLGLSQYLNEEGVWRPGKRPVREAPEPVMITITHPRARMVTLPERKWNALLPFAESLWLALGWNDLDALPGRYIKKLYDFSDDGHSWRAGYGPRIRQAFPIDLVENDRITFHRLSVSNKKLDVVDQLAWVIEVLTKDPHSRQAVITVADPNKDCILTTKDQPCTRSLQFIQNDGKLDMIVHMRSNDLLWGFSAVNVFNFTFMQEYVAGLLGLPLGHYHHLAANLHYYGDMQVMIDALGQSDPARALEGDVLFSEPAPYNKGPTSLADFDEQIEDIKDIEQLAFDRQTLTALASLRALSGTLAHDWALVFVRENVKRQGWPGPLPDFIDQRLNRYFPGGKA